MNNYPDNKKRRKKNKQKKAQQPSLLYDLYSHTYLFLINTFNIDIQLLLLTGRPKPKQAPIYYLCSIVHYKATI